MSDEKLTYMCQHFILRQPENYSRPMEYEFHITLRMEDYFKAEQIIRHTGFHMSRITDDPVIGKGAKAYITGHTNEEHEARVIVGSLRIVLQTMGIPCLRCKIEKTLMDERIEDAAHKQGQ